MPPLRSSSAAALGTMLTCTTSSPSVASSSAFPAITSFPPQASVPKTSATLTSKLIEVEKSTDERSSSVTFSRSQCSRTTTEEWRIITPFGRPVDPEVKMTCDRFSGTAPLSGAAADSAAIASRSTSSRRSAAAVSARWSV